MVILPGSTTRDGTVVMARLGHHLADRPLVASRAPDCNAAARTTPLKASTGSVPSGRYTRRTDSETGSRVARSPLLQTAVMQILWDAEPEALTAAQVQKRLRPQHPVAYTTAMTVLVRLWQKEMLHRRKSGRAYAYTTKESQPDYEARRMAEILHSMDDRSVTLSRFFDELTDDEREQLQFLINDDS